MNISSLIRDVSQQDPTDLRIRRRKTPLTDAPVLEIFQKLLTKQHERLIKYWLVAGRQPGKIIPPTVIQGDSRNVEILTALSLDKGSVDCVITSPPYATALPYIDTDRLSLLAIMGITSRNRSNLEENITGSREIRKSSKTNLEDEIHSPNAKTLLPTSIVNMLRKLHATNSKAGVGFRRENMPSLLWRYCIDMKQNLETVKTSLKPGGKAIYVVGDSRTKAGEEWMTIKTCKFISDIAEMVGLTMESSISIDVTKENYKHSKNSITKNEILIFEKI